MQSILDGQIAGSEFVATNVSQRNSSAEGFAVERVFHVTRNVVAKQHGL